MGIAGYRTEQGIRLALMHIIKGETKFILHIRGHTVQNTEQKTSRLVSLEDASEITKDVIDYYIE